MNEPSQNTADEYAEVAYDEDVDDGSGNLHGTGKWNCIKIKLLALKNVQ